MQSRAKAAVRSDGQRDPFASAGPQHLAPSRRDDQCSGWRARQGHDRDGPLEGGTKTTASNTKRTTRE